MVQSIIKSGMTSLVERNTVLTKLKPGHSQLRGDYYLCLGFIKRHISHHSDIIRPRNQT